jgi:ribosomal protein L40E
MARGHRARTRWAFTPSSSLTRCSRITAVCDANTLSGRLLPVDMAGTVCRQCGQSLPPEAKACPRCGRVVDLRQTESPTTVRPKPPPSTYRKLLWIVVVLLVVAAILLGVLYSVPFPVRVTVRDELPSPAATPSGCGTHVGGLDLSVGHTIHLSWSAIPPEVVALSISPLAGGSVVYNASGTSGSGTFSSTVPSYIVLLTNCGSTATTVTISAYYDSEAPLL